MLKKITVAIALTGLMAGAAYAGISAGTGINGSRHDMNAITGTAKDGMLRSCVFCHTPHNAAATLDGPLWNRATTLLNPAAYGWIAPANSAITIADPLVGPTRLCMSCHDGSIAYDSHNGSIGANAAAPGTVFLGATHRAHVDIAVTHPIGFQYALAVTKRPGELVPITGSFISGPSTDLAANTFDTKARTIAAAGRKIADTLYQGNVTCASCHEVHNTNNAVSDTGKTYNYFLNAREEGSAICLSCHIK
ncbi:MAG: hypothetical protein WCK54_19805 [Desulfuromonadales bacterium]